MLLRPLETLLVPAGFSGPAGQAHGYLQEPLELAFSFSIGILIRNSVPRPGAELISTINPPARILARIPTNPRPFGPVREKTSVTLKPAPSALTLQFKFPLSRVS